MSCAPLRIPSSAGMKRANRDLLSVDRKAIQIFEIRRKDRRSGLGHRYEDGVDHRSCFRTSSQVSGTLGNFSRQGVVGLAHLEEFVDQCISALPSRYALREHDCGHDRRPESLSLEFFDVCKRLLALLREMRNGARIKDQHRHPVTSDSQSCFKLSARAAARRLCFLDGSPTCARSSAR